MNTQDLLKLAYSYEKEGDLLKALEYCNHAIQKEPKNDLLYCKRGEINYEFGEYFEAIQDFTKAIEIKIDDYYLYLRGVCKYLLGLHDWALKDLEKGLIISPDDSEIWRYKAYILKEQNKWEDSLNSYIKASQFDKSSSTTLYEISQLYLRLSKFELAITSIKQALEIEPMEDYKKFLSEIIAKSGNHPIHSFSNFFDGEIIEND